MLFSFFVAAIAIQILRNPFQISEPALFAEDTIWIEMILNNGLVFALLNGRLEYPIYLPVILDWLGFLLNSLFFGENINNLPRFTALFSYLFLASNSLLGFLVVLKLSRSVFAASMCAVFVLTIPLSEVATTIGHNLQWGHVVPFTSGMLFILRRSFKHTLIHDLIQVILILTLPVCLLNLVLYLACYSVNFRYEAQEVRFSFNDEVIDPRSRNILLFLFVGFSVFFMLKLNIGSNKSGSTDPIDFANAIEFLIFRPFLFLFFCHILQKFNDITTLIVFFNIYLLPLLWAKSYKKPTTDHVFIVLCFFAYLLTFAIMRGGISKIFHYLDTYLHFYYFGLSMYTTVFLSLILASLPGVRYSTIFTVFFQIWLNNEQIFQTRAEQPNHIPLAHAIKIAYDRNCGNRDCTVPATDVYWVDANPSVNGTNKTRLPANNVRASANGE